MKTNKQSKIKVPKSGFKRSRFNWSHDVNTTFSWGEIQPTQCKLLIPGSKTTMSTQSLIRLAPMVAPTFGRVKYKTYNQFVNISEIFPNFDAMMAQEPKSTGYGTRVPQSIPYVKLGVLCANILYGARATLYFADNATDAANGEYWTQYRSAPNVVPNTNDPNCGDWYDHCAHILGSSSKPFDNFGPDVFNHAANGVMPEINGLVMHLFKFGNAYSVHGNNNLSVVLGTPSMADLCPVRQDYTPGAPATSPLSLKDYQKEVTFNSADYVLEGSYEYSSGKTEYFALAVELSDFGKRLRKVFQGCGYQIDFQSNMNVSILPLLAQYKAYFDIFGLELYQGWETTYCAQIIKDIENRFLDNVTARFQRTNKGALATINNSNNGLAFIMTELVNEWYTDDADYVSAHIAKLGVSPIVTADGFVDLYSQSNGDPYIYEGKNVAATTDDMTQGSDMIYGSQKDNGDASTTNNSTNVGGIPWIDGVKHTQIDAELLKRIYKWCNRNTVLGRRIAELLRAQGLGKYVDECKSNYIGSTDTLITISDVVSTAATEDAALGEYGGKGLQYDQSGTLVFENDSYGYWVTLATVVPEAGYTQGLDPTLTSLDKFNLYNPDFDAIGMELTPKANVVGNQYICDPTIGSQGYNGFGFIPRYSKFKVCNNLTNGDFNRHGKRATYMPYTLDKQLNVNDYSVDAESYKFQDLAHKIWNYVKLDKSVKTNSMPIAGNVWRQPTKFNWLGNFNRIFLNVGQRDDSDIANVNAGDAIGFTDYNDDNFLGHHIYNVQSYAPMKPIEDSYGLDDMDDPNGKAGVEFTSKA